MLRARGKASDIQKILKEAEEKLRPNVGLINAVLARQDVSFLTTEVKDLTNKILTNIQRLLSGKLNNKILNEIIVAIAYIKDLLTQQTSSSVEPPNLTILNELIRNDLLQLKAKIDAANNQLAPKNTYQHTITLDDLKQISPKNNKYLKDKNPNFFSQGSGGVGQFKRDYLRSQALTLNKKTHLGDNKLSEEVSNDYIYEKLDPIFGEDNTDNLLKAHNQAFVGFVLNTLASGIDHTRFIVRLSTNKTWNLFKGEDEQIYVEYQASYEISEINKGILLLQTQPVRSLFKMANINGRWGFQLVKIETNDDLVNDILHDNMLSAEAILNKHKDYRDYEDKKAEILKTLNSINNTELTRLVNNYIKLLDASTYDYLKARASLDHIANLIKVIKIDSNNPIEFRLDEKALSSAYSDLENYINLNNRYNKAIQDLGHIKGENNLEQPIKNQITRLLSVAKVEYANSKDVTRLRDLVEDLSKTEEFLSNIKANKENALVQYGNYIDTAKDRPHCSRTRGSMKCLLATVMVVGAVVAAPFCLACPLLLIPCVGLCVWGCAIFADGARELAKKEPSNFAPRLFNTMSNNMTKLKEAVNSTSNTIASQQKSAI